MVTRSVWSDNETNRDFLNFRLVADMAAEVIVQANGRPLSLGICGSWGVGKSSMIKLLQDSLAARSDAKFLVVNFNAWLYQGYDDARAALMDVIARRLVQHAEDTRTGLDKAKDLLERVDWLRLAKLAATSGVALAFGVPPIGLVGDAIAAIQRLAAGSRSKEDLKTAAESSTEAIATAKSFIKDKPPESPPKEIQDLRDHFEDTLKGMGITLVVFIDDLDRCLPPTTIATLEAIRLFLFLKNTAFVIAADDELIRRAVRAHFKDMIVDDELVTNYFDKLIQVPIRVPPLGTQDVRAYIMLLFIENSALPQQTKDELRERVCKQLGETWLGKRVDRAFVVALIKDCPSELLARLDMADRLAPMMASAKQIAGNPRLVKRFLNTLAIRMSIARIQGVSVDEAALTKMLLFERCGGDEAYANLVAAINGDDEGKPRYLKPLEEKVAAGGTIDNKEIPSGWNLEFAAKWLAMPPFLADRDMRSIVYVSREHLPLVTAADQLSSDAADLLAALLELTQPSKSLAGRISELSKREKSLLMDQLLTRARQTQEWGNEPILAACFTVAAADPDQVPRVAAFLAELSPKQLKPAIVPLIGRESWGRDVLQRWRAASDTPTAVKRAINAELRDLH